MPEKERKSPQETQKHDAALLQMIVDEVDAARDTLELVSQLQRELPLRRFDDVRRALGPEGLLHFRGQKYPVGWFENAVPSVLFPIEDVRALVERMANVVRLIPDHVGASPDTAYGLERAQKRMWFQPPNGLPPGVLSSGPTPAGISRINQGAAENDYSRREDK
uniref:Uncharacterized protein n=1 Tax=Solibacter usitatus (strain Ellin6076) TaxID=234267 RepID=Q01Z12_SOLUE